MTSIQSQVETIRKNVLSSNVTTILAATKGRTSEQIREAFEAGIRVIGENRVQEMLEKLPLLPQDLRIDFIGHLQTNKVKEVVKHCYLIHSVDSWHLAEEIDHQAELLGKVQNILLEVNLSREATKYGFTKDEVVNHFQKLLALSNIKILGLMTIAPNSRDPEMSRSIFKNLREIKTSLEKKFNISLPELSMGMTDDYQVAIEEGATIIRLGRIIFGER